MGQAEPRFLSTGLPTPNRFNHIGVNNRRVLMKGKEDIMSERGMGRTNIRSACVSYVLNMRIPPVVDMCDKKKKESYRIVLPVSSGLDEETARG